MNFILKILFLLSFFSNLGFSKDYRLIIDTEGRKVKVPQKVKRIVVLTGTCIETIYILGEINKVVGISKPIADSPFISKLIKDLKKIPVVAQDLRNVDLEKILALKPDLIIGIGPEHPYGMSAELVKRIENFNLPLILLNLENLNENYYSIELLGQIFNQERKAKELVNYMKSIEKEIVFKVSQIPVEKRVKALMLSQKPTLVLGGYWKNQDPIFMAGGFNVAFEIKDFVAEVSIERIIAWNPEVITIVGSAPYEPKDLLNNPLWKNIKAVREGKVYKYPLQITGLFTPRVVLLLAWHASKFYPELKLDWIKITDNFFKKFYGISYDGPRN
ncbi:MAG: ABC transporter substrate-binding protein [Thermodesulfobacteriaceae bacterium]|nr:ABC transporter substrate-binding protein [Thermodesulfobacteriaceae bacterium]